MTDVLIIDGLTKRFRLPGWRVAWILGPKEFIKAMGSCGSYLDGGTNVPFQEAAVSMLEVCPSKTFPLPTTPKQQREENTDKITSPANKSPQRNARPPTPLPRQTRLRPRPPAANGLPHPIHAQLNLLHLARPLRSPPRHLRRTPLHGSLLERKSHHGAGSVL